MPSIKSGLRLRLALGFAAFHTLLVAALGLAFYAGSEHLERTLVGQLIGDEMTYLTEGYARDPSFAPRFGPNVQTYITHGGDENALPAYMRGLAPGHHTAHDSDSELHVLIQQRDATRFYVVYDLGYYEQREQQLQVLLVVTVILAALSSLGLGYLLSGFLLRPVTDLARRVAQLDSDTAPEPLARAGQDAEVASLARALDAYRARMAESIRREQEFGANASHELRTPLTAVQTGCELLLTDEALPAHCRARVESILLAAQRMGEQLQALLFLARGQVGTPREMVMLEECAMLAADPYRGEFERKGIALELAIQPGVALSSNRQALQLVLGNLIKNALQHTEHGYVRVAYEDRQLTVSDSGSGIAAEHLPHVFERFYRGAGAGSTPGSGLGLAIVKRICDHFHWTVNVRSERLRGTTFSITLA